MSQKICCLLHAIQLVFRRPDLTPEYVTVPEADDCGRTFEQFITDWSAKITQGTNPTGE